MEKYISAIYIKKNELVIVVITTSDKICFKAKDNRVRQGQYIMPGESKICSNVIYEHRY